MESKSYQSLEELQNGGVRLQNDVRDKEYKSNAEDTIKKTSEILCNAIVDGISGEINKVADDYSVRQYVYHKIRNCVASIMDDLADKKHYGYFEWLQKQIDKDVKEGNIPGAKKRIGKVLTSALFEGMADALKENIYPALEANGFFGRNPDKFYRKYKEDAMNALFGMIKCKSIFKADVPEFVDDIVNGREYIFSAWHYLKDTSYRNLVKVLGYSIGMYREVERLLKK